MSKFILILLIVAVVVVGGVLLVEAWNGQQDARAHRLAEEANLVRAQGHADAARISAGAEAASVRADANGRMLAMMFPYLIVFGLAALAIWTGYALVNRQQATPAHAADMLALAALGRMWLAAQEQERLEILTRAEVLESGNQRLPQ